MFVDLCVVVMFFNLCEVAVMIVNLCVVVVMFVDLCVVAVMFIDLCVVGVRQGCLLSPTIFNIFLERIIRDALEDHEGIVSIGGRTITNLRFADDIDGLAGEEEELANLLERLDKASTAYEMRSVPRRPS